LSVVARYGFGEVVESSCSGELGIHPRARSAVSRRKAMSASRNKVGGR